MYIATIEQSISHNTFLSLKYKNGIGVVSERKVEPKALFFEQNEWKFIAFCHFRQEHRQFLLKRIHSLELLSDEFAPHQFSLENYFNQQKSQ